MEGGLQAEPNPHASGLAAGTLSRTVLSNQAGLHPRLDAIVRRHLDTVFRKPPAAYSIDAFARLQERVADAPALVLDSACGTGESTAALARCHPDALVVGVDQSLERLTRGGRKLAASLPANALLLRADVTDLWALMREAGLRVAHHYLLYPNPWPKAEHVRRRWSGHPRLPELLALGGQLELRTNWEVYALEFARALALAGHAAHTRAWAVPPDGALTPFERKYAASGHRLWRLSATLDRQAGNTPVER